MTIRSTSIPSRRRPRPSRDPVDPRTARIYKYHRRRGATPKEATRLAKLQRGSRIVGHVGDIDWIEHGGGPIIRDEEGRYSLEYVVRTHSRRYEVYQVDLDREPLPSWVDAKGVASFIGESPSILRRRWYSRNPLERAQARTDVAAYHGWANFDQYPLRMTRSELRTRYRR